MTKGKRLVHKISKCKYSDSSANEINTNTGNSFAKILCYKCWVWGKSQPSPLLQISRSYSWAPAHMNSLATFTGLGLRCFPSAPLIFARVAEGGRPKMRSTGGCYIYNSIHSCCAVPVVLKVAKHKSKTNNNDKHEDRHETTGANTKNNPLHCILNDHNITFLITTIALSSLARPSQACC